MQAEVTVDRVQSTETRSGNRRFVLRDADGKEYTTFRPQIGNEAAKYEGRRARIEFHEEERNGFTNVYLDRIAPADDKEDPARPDADAEETAWQTAVEAAPWLIGTSAPDRQVEPGELFEKLKPFQEKVAEDIREGDD
jgi:hypothetical protein